MWTLFVLAWMPDIGEYKAVIYDEYPDQMVCHIEQAVLEATFLNDEIALCVSETK